MDCPYCLSFLVIHKKSIPEPLFKPVAGLLDEVKSISRPDTGI
jgi:hypothetical protein